MEMQGARLWLVRHGQTDWNAAGRIQGHTPTDLNEAGRGEAGVLAKFFAGREFAEVWASDLPRALVTAELIVAGRGVEVRKSEALRERCFAEFEGCTTEEIRVKRHALGGEHAKWGGDLADWTGVPGVETNDAVWERVKGKLLEIAEGNLGKDVLVVTHGGVVSRAVYRVLGIEDGVKRKFPLSNGIVAVLQRRGEGFYLMSLIDVPLVMGGMGSVDTANAGGKK